jgi:hypothetical protein
MADNAWLLLLSRLAAGLSIPVIVGAFVFSWDMNAEQAVMADRLDRHDLEITRNAERISLRETNAFTQADAAAMEARLVARDDQLLEELRIIRRQLTQDRREP